MKAGGQDFLNVIAVGDVAEPIIASEPKREFPQPSLLRVDRTRRLDQKSNAIVHPQRNQIAALVVASDGGGDFRGTGVRGGLGRWGLQVFDRGVVDSGQHGAERGRGRFVESCGT